MILKLLNARITKKRIPTGIIEPKEVCYLTYLRTTRNIIITPTINTSSAQGKEDYKRPSEAGGPLYTIFIKKLKLAKNSCFFSQLVTFPFQRQNSAKRGEEKGGKGSGFIPFRAHAQYQIVAMTPNPTRTTLA